MALRNILKDGDDTLRMTARPVTEFDKRLWQILDDMKDTMYNAEGVGLAAPQIGILRRIFVIDVNDGKGFIEFINPEITESSGEQIYCEGCLSIPGITGNVKRPETIKVKAYDRNGEEFIYVGSGLAAVCVSHENDHLNGILFTDKIIEEK